MIDDPQLLARCLTLAEVELDRAVRTADLLTPSYDVAEARRLLAVPAQRPRPAGRPSAPRTITLGVAVLAAAAGLWHPTTAAASATQQHPRGRRRPPAIAPAANPGRQARPARRSPAAPR